jgi:hypothetical protein
MSTKKRGSSPASLKWVYVTMLGVISEGRIDHQQGCRTVLQKHRRTFHDRDVSQTNGLPPTPKVVCLDRTSKAADSRREEDRAVQLPACILRQAE